MHEPLTIVGQPVPRLDAVAKVTGQARYSADLPRLPGELQAKVLRSPLPHARIRRIDASAARALPGVVAVLTGADLDLPNPYYGTTLSDQPVVAIDRVRYVGDAVAAVAAEDRITAERALRLIDVEYEPLPALMTIEAALAPGAPLIHETADPGRDPTIPNPGGIELCPIPGTNICQHYHYERGDVAAAFAASAHVFEHRFSMPMTSAAPLEPHATLADFRDGGLTLWTGTQLPHPMRQLLARLFALPKERVRIVVPFIGGGFGAKECLPIFPIAAELSRRAGRPVRLVLTSQETFLTTCRNAVQGRIKTGLAADGTILAREAEVYLDDGAYSDQGPNICSRVGFRVPGPYRIPNLRVDSFSVRTNKVPAGAYRGYGGPEAAWIYESHTDLIARAIGLDPIGFRRKNLLALGEAFIPNNRPVDADLRALLDIALQEIRWDEPAGPNCGKAVVTCLKDAGGRNAYSEADLKLAADGRLAVLASTAEMGQGAVTVLAQIAAEAFPWPFGRVDVVLPDTEVCPYDQRTAQSRSTTVMGRAVQDAAARLRRQLCDAAARWLDRQPGEVTIEDGLIRAGEERFEVGEFFRRAFDPPVESLMARGTMRTTGDQITFWEAAAAAARVHVDPDTGQVRVLDYVTVSDAGRAINPRQAHGQEEGAAVMGLGAALSETLHFDPETGALLNGSFGDFPVPTFEDAPAGLHSVIIESGNGPGPWGAKGLGESGILAPAPLLASAVADATGARLHELPLDPEKVWRALRVGSRQ